MIESGGPESVFPDEANISKMREMFDYIVLNDMCHQDYEF
jgi:hypothetical protein